MGDYIPAILIMSFTTAVCWVVVYKLVKARQASHWPTVEGTITKSETRGVKESHSGQGSTVKTLASLEYEYKIAGYLYRNTQIRAGDKFGVVPGPEVLDRFPRGAKVPVYYNPASAAESVLITGLSYSAAKAWTFAAALFMAGVGASLLFSHLDVEMEKLRAIFPVKAEPQGAIFFGLCSAWVIFMTVDNWRQAHRAKGWPVAEGVVKSSRVEARKTRAGGARGTRVTLHEPVVEYLYTVGGREYFSSQVSFGARVSTQEEAPAAAWAGKYPEGAKVVVHYNPEHPSVAVLETGVAFQGGMVAIAVVMVAASVFFCGVRP
ncbi:MAG TPA: DUF3592 domain-containing protein [Bryobacteraceae bacterium]|jgi:hypothetical protein